VSITDFLDDLSSTQAAIGDNSLNLGCLLSLLSILSGPSTTNDVLLNEGYTILLLETKESSETSESLGTKAARHVDGSDT